MLGVRRSSGHRRQPALASAGERGRRGRHRDGLVLFLLASSARWPLRLGGLGGGFWYCRGSGNDSGSKLGGLVYWGSGAEVGLLGSVDCTEEKWRGWVDAGMAIGSCPGQRDEAVAGWVIGELPLFIAWVWAKRNP